MCLMRIDHVELTFHVKIMLACFMLGKLCLLQELFLF